MLVGRDRELRAVADLIVGRRPVVLTGPAGIGKSTLAVVAAARSGSGEAPRTTGALASRQAASMFAFERLLRRRLPSPEAAARAVLRAGDVPLVVDDLQWADDPTFEALGLLAGSLGLVATVRSGEAGAERAIAIGELLGADVVELAPLSPDAAAHVLAERHPALSDERHAEVLAAAAGNPLLLEELPRGESAATTLVSALLARTGALEPPARRALGRLAVLGRPATPGELGPGTDELLAAGLARRDDALGAVAIAHTLLGEIVVDQLGSAADDHRRSLAEELADADAAPLLAAAGDHEAARARALAAASAADDRRRAELLELAVGLAPDLDAPGRFEAARLLTATSRPDRAIALCTVEGIDDLPPLPRGMLAAARAEASWMLGRVDESRRLTEQALGDLRGTGTIYEALVLAGSTTYDTFLALDGRPALARAREAWAMAERLGEGRAYCRTRLASVLAMAGDPSWTEHYRAAVDLAREEGDDDQYRTAVVGMLLATWATGDVAEAERLALKELDAEVPDELDLSWLSVAAYAAVLGSVAGRPPAELIDRFGPIARDEPAFRHRPFLVAAVAIALAEVGRHDDAERLVADARKQLSVEPELGSLLVWARLELAWARGDDPTAVEAAEDLLALEVGDYPAAVMGRLVGAHAARVARRPAPGPPPSPLLPAWWAAPIEWAALEQAHDDTEAAAAGLLEAADAWAGSDVRSELRCRWAAADLLAAVDPDRAAALLLELEPSVADRPAMAGRVRRSLRAAGVDRRMASAPGPGGLTMREVQVLDLVGQGRRSAEIAAALGLTVATVDSFVASARRTLGAPTRAAAAARLVALRAAADGDPLSEDEAAGPIG